MHGTREIPSCCVRMQNIADEEREDLLNKRNSHHSPRELVITGNQLSYEHIDLAQKILAAQFPALNGLQSPLNLSAIDKSYEKCIL